MSSSENNYQFWQKKRGKIVTSIGKWVGGDDVQIRQYSLLKDLFQQVSYMQLQVLNATGKLISPELGRWLENNFMVMSYPDARIWCNQVGAFAGTLKTSPTAATVAGCLAADSRVYGGSQTSEHAMRFIQHALVQHKAGSGIAELVAAVPVRQGKPAIVGFARPVARTDERIVPHQQMTEALGFAKGEHMLLAEQLADYMQQHFGMGINIGGYTAAFMSDQGFTPEEVYRIKNLCVSSGVTACYQDQLTEPEHSFLPWRCDDVDYQGHSPRPVPD